MNVKYQIFVSSTYEDLKDERNEIIKACLNMGHIPVGMEMFNAADEEQWAVITRTINQCDYYVVIVAHRYGSMVDGTSFTEKEYDYAIEQGVPVLGFVIEDGASWPNDRTDKDQASIEALRAFKSKVKQKMVRNWGDKSQVQAHFAMSLSTYINLKPRRGWVQAPEAGAADVAQTLSNLTEENARLRQELDEVRSSKPDEVNDAIKLLNAEVGDFGYQQLFMEAMDASIVGKFVIGKFIRDKTMHLNSKDSNEQTDSLRRAIHKFRLWGLIQPVARDLWDITELGRKVYSRLDLERRFRHPN